MLEEMRTEMIRSRAETRALREELAVTREQLGAAARAKDTPGPIGNQGGEQSLEKLEEEQQLLNAKVDEQYQTKVESASKYRVRLSGMILMNLFSNRNVVDNIDFPNLALQDGPVYSEGNVGGTLRQSQLGLEVFGPQIKGARVSA